MTQPGIEPRIIYKSANFRSKLSFPADILLYDCIYDRKLFLVPDESIRYLNIFIVIFKEYYRQKNRLEFKAKQNIMTDILVIEKRKLLAKYSRKE